MPPIREREEVCRGRKVGKAKGCAQVPPIRGGAVRPPLPLCPLHQSGLRMPRVQGGNDGSPAGFRLDHPPAVTEVSRPLLGPRTNP